jgi:hypothetical protein
MIAAAVGEKQKKINKSAVGTQYKESEALRKMKPQRFIDILRTYLDRDNQEPSPMLRWAVDGEEIRIKNKPVADYDPILNLFGIRNKEPLYKSVSRELRNWGSSYRYNRSLSLNFNSTDVLIWISFFLFFFSISSRL